MTRATMILWVLHAAGNLILFWLLYAWLGIGDQKTVQLLMTALVAFFLLLCAAWLHGAAFLHFRQPAGVPLRDTFQTALGRLPALFTWALIAGMLYWLVGLLSDASFSPANKIASWLTLTLRKPVKPESVQTIFTWFFRILTWFVMPVLLLPLGSEVAGKGLLGFFGQAHRVSRRPLYWVQCVLLLLLAIWVPYQLIHWVPGVRGLSVELVSFIARFGLAYFLFVTGWLALLFVSSGGRPVLTQPQTAPLP